MLKIRIYKMSNKMPTCLKILIKLYLFNNPKEINYFHNNNNKHPILIFLQIILKIKYFQYNLKYCHSRKINKNQ